MQDVTGLLATMIVLIALSGLFPIALVMFEVAQHQPDTLPQEAARAASIGNEAGFSRSSP
jgi:hypothetical protein